MSYVIPMVFFTPIWLFFFFFFSYLVLGCVFSLLDLFLNIVLYVFGTTNLSIFIDQIFSSIVVNFIEESCVYLLDC